MSLMMHEIGYWIGSDNAAEIDFKRMHWMYIALYKPFTKPYPDAFVYLSDTA